MCPQPVGLHCEYPKPLQEFTHHVCEHTSLLFPNVFMPLDSSGENTVGKNTVMMQHLICKHISNELFEYKCTHAYKALDHSNKNGFNFS